MLTKVGECLRHKLLVVPFNKYLPLLHQFQSVFLRFLREIAPQHYVLPRLVFQLGNIWNSPSYP